MGVAASSTLDDEQPVTAESIKSVSVTRKPPKTVLGKAWFDEEGVVIEYKLGADFSAMYASVAEQLEIESNRFRIVSLWTGELPRTGKITREFKQDEVLAITPLAAHK